MRTFLNYIFVGIAFILLILFYFFYTNSGQKNAYILLSFYASHKAGVDVDIQELHIHQFPYIRVKAIVEEQYALDIDGFVKNKHMDLRYELNSECFKSNICTFDDMIHIEGKIKGWVHDVSITGEGQAFNGLINYSFSKQKQIFKNVNLHLKDVNSSKLASLLKQKAVFKGNATTTIHFDTIGAKHKIGTIIYDVKDNNFYDINASFHTQVYIKDDKHTFNIDIVSPDAVLHLTEGNYDQNKKYAHANYTVDVPDLSKLKKLLGGTYVGTFQAHGEMEYDKQIKIKGLSNNLNGELRFIYDSKTLELLFNNISFPKLMQTLKQKPIGDANISGHAVYDTITKSFDAKTKFKHTKLLPSSLTQKIQKKFAINLADEVFDNSTLELNYKDKLLTSNLKLANNKMHFILNDTKFNASYNAIDTQIDFEIPKHAAKGHLYARVDTIGEKHLDDIYLKFDGFLEKHYKVKLDGLLSEAFINMDYAISAARLPSHVCTIVDDINLSGHISGPFDRLHLVGNGTAMEGKVYYSGIKMKDSMEDVTFNFRNIHALKLFTLLGQPTLPNGKADVKGNFSYFNEKKMKGHLIYNLTQGHYEKLPLTLRANVTIDDKLVSFDSNAVLSTADINVTKGKYNLETNILKSFYAVKTKDLAPLKPLIGKYNGPFSAMGEITYDKQFQIRGLSKTFGGMVDFLYKKEMLYVDLEKISLTRFMGLFPYPHILDAQVNGNINYDYKIEKLLVRTDLNNTRFLNSDLVETVFDKSGVNMLKEVFPYSTLRATYQDKKLVGNVMLKNNQSHFYLTNIEVDEKIDTVNAFFDLKMQGQEFSGKIYGSLEKPKINLNMQKLIRYQMDKQLDTYMGKGNRKMMESMPMGDVAKDVAAEMGAGFMGIFF